jgi:hypothetical protein
VFNAKRHSIRVVTIKPTRMWSTNIGDAPQLNNSSLGADVGVGYLHTLPIDKNRDIIVESNVYAAPLSQSQVNDLPLTGLNSEPVIDNDTINTPQSIQHPAHIPADVTVETPKQNDYVPPPFKPVVTRFVPTSSQHPHEHHTDPHHHTQQQQQNTTQQYQQPMQQQSGQQQSAPQSQQAFKPYLPRQPQAFDTHVSPSPSTTL